MTTQYEDAMNTLEKMINQQEGKLFEPYIRYIRFPLSFVSIGRKRIVDST